MFQFRAFISYSRDDSELAQQISEILQKCGVNPFLDTSIEPGSKWSDEIRKRISRSHFFVSILTKTSRNSVWVNQEIGFATALGLPQLPIALGDVDPGGMQTSLNAIKGETIEDIERTLKSYKFDSLVLPPPHEPTLTFEVADSPAERTRLLGDYSFWVANFRGPVRIRQRGAFSSFSLPEQEPNHRIWLLHDGRDARDEGYHKLQQRERRAFQAHAEACGATLFIDPTVRLPNRGDRAVLIRLVILHLCLANLLEKSKCKNADAAIRVVTTQDQSDSLTIIGDWFVARSQAPGVGGYRGTVFDWSAPKAREAQMQFDSLFNELNQNKAGACPTRCAMEQIANEIVKLESSLKILSRHVYHPGNQTFDLDGYVDGLLGYPA